MSTGRLQPEVTYAKNSSQESDGQQNLYTHYYCITYHRAFSSFFFVHWYQSRRSAVILAMEDAPNGEIPSNLTAFMYAILLQF